MTGWTAVSATTILVHRLGSQIVELNGEGNDTVWVTRSASYFLQAGASIETLLILDDAATNPVKITGNEFNNTLKANAGNDQLNGGGGNDVLFGLGGNDLYFVDAGDQVVEAAGAGNDTVKTSTSYGLLAGASVETLQTDERRRTTAINLSGNEFANTIFGNAGNNVLDGRAGADTCLASPATTRSMSTMPATRSSRLSARAPTTSSRR